VDELDDDTTSIASSSVTSTSAKGDPQDEDDMEADGDENEMDASDTPASAADVIPDVQTLLDQISDLKQQLTNKGIQITEIQQYFVEVVEDLKQMNCTTCTCC
jgi:hypothetical protein